MHAECLRDRREHEVRIDDRGEWNETDPVREVVSQLSSHLQGEPSLANAARAGQRQEADVRPAQQRNHRRRFARSPHERGEGLRDRGRLPFRRNEYRPRRVTQVVRRRYGRHSAARSFCPRDKSTQYYRTSLNSPTPR